MAEPRSSPVAVLILCMAQESAVASIRYMRSELASVVDSMLISPSLMSLPGVQLLFSRFH